MKTKPNKPSLYITKNEGGLNYRAPAFHNDSQIHTAMEDYANKLSEFYCGDEFGKEIWFDFNDGSSESTVVERNKGSFTYKTYDGEEWEEEYCVASWYESLYEIKSTSLKVIAKKLADFLECGEDIKEIRYNNA